MYVPAHFLEERLPVLHQAMREVRLPTLVTMGGEGLEASHLPLWLEAEEGGNGALYGHLAKANGQWKRVTEETPALAIFLGPEAYVTPSYYPSKQEHGKAVPTWNYLAVHAYGRLEFFEDAERLTWLLGKLTERHEAGRADPWAMADAPADYLASMLKAIVGFRLPIERLEGKWKLSQNRTPEDRAGVVKGLLADGETGLAKALEN
jgi:transcriptional regulator